MATNPPSTMLFHLTLVQNLHGQVIQNGYYFMNVNNWLDTNTVANLSTNINLFKNVIVPKITAMQSQEVVHRSIILQQLYPHDGPMSELILETTGGIQPFESLPSYNAAILTLRTGFGGKSNRGRSYYAGISIGFGTGGRLDADLLAQLQDTGNQLLNTFGGSSVQSALRYCVYSRRIAAIAGAPPHPGGAKPVVQTVARSVIGTQRHRKIGIGN